MRSINFSEDNLTIQRQYVKRNLDDMGIRTDQIENKKDIDLIKYML